MTTFNDSVACESIGMFVSADLLTSCRIHFCMHYCAGFGLSPGPISASDRMRIAESQDVRGEERRLHKRWGDMCGPDGVWRWVRFESHAPWKAGLFRIGGKPPLGGTVVLLAAVCNNSIDVIVTGVGEE